MRYICYTGGALDKAADLIIAGDGVFTITRCFGSSIPYPRVLSEIRGLAPLLPGLFFKKDEEMPYASVDFAPSYHVLMEPILPAIDEQRIYQYVIARQGVFLLARSRDIELLLPISCHGTLPMLAELFPYLHFRHPRIGKDIVAQLLERSLAARTHDGQFKERLFYLTWEKGAWRLHEPDQDATPGSVGALSTTPEYVNAIIEGHSHHEIKPFFSATDNIDEVLNGGFRIFFVLGYITTRPELLVRICLHGYCWQLPASYFFSLPAQVHESAQWEGGL